MATSYRTTSRAPQAALRRLCAALFLALGSAQAASIPSGNEAPPVRVQSLVGTWSVEQWMWPGPGSNATALPRALAHREMVGNNFVQEIMTGPAGAHSSFTRISFFGYNAIAQQYEYFSLDTRAPQIMTEHGVSSPGAQSEALNLLGGTFVAAQWGARRNAAFRYRIVVGSIRDDRQDVELYLTPIGAPPKTEFLAFKYVYTRKR